VDNGKEDENQSQSTQPTQPLIQSQQHQEQHQQSGLRLDVNSSDLKPTSSKSLIEALKDSIKVHKKDSTLTSEHESTSQKPIETPSSESNENSEIKTQELSENYSSISAIDLEHVDEKEKMRLLNSIAKQEKKKKKEEKKKRKEEKKKRKEEKKKKREERKARKEEKERKKKEEEKEPSIRVDEENGNEENEEGNPIPTQLLFDAMEREAENKRSLIDEEADESDENGEDEVSESDSENDDQDDNDKQEGSDDESIFSYLFVYFHLLFVIFIVELEKQYDWLVEQDNQEIQSILGRLGIGSLLKRARDGEDLGERKKRHNVNLLCFLVCSSLSFCVSSHIG